MFFKGGGGTERRRSIKSVFRRVVDPDPAPKLLAKYGSGKIIPNLDSSGSEINLKYDYSEKMENLQFLNKNAQYKYINYFL